LLFAGAPRSMTGMGEPDLRAAWADLLERRAALAPTLVMFGEIVALWAREDAGIRPLAQDAAVSRATWADRRPLVTVAAPGLAVDDVERYLGPAMDLLVGLRPDLADAVQRLAEAWDRGAVTPHDLLPGRGRVGRVPAGVDVDADAVAFLAGVALRPFLEPYFAGCREHLEDVPWDLGVCPFCGAPPGFGDLVEDGRRRLSCHLCGGGWIFSRLRCPLCGTDDGKRLVRLDPSQGDEGYYVAACAECRGYVKELDRRVRWNAGPSLVEDWGSPHLDLAAQRAGYWRPLPSLVQLAGSSPR
jgi:hypothetical protein